MPIPDELLKDLPEEDRLIITTVLEALGGWIRGSCPVVHQTARNRRRRQRVRGQPVLEGTGDA
jgi:hypothetical protein